MSLRGPPKRKSSKGRSDNHKQKIAVDKLLFLYGGQCNVIPKSPSGRRQAPPPALIWDLDQTLVSSYDPDDLVVPELEKDWQARYYDLGEINMFGWHRPGAKEIVKYSHKHHTPTIVWTAGDEIYGPAIVEVIFDKWKPFKVFTRKDCLEPEESEKSLIKPIETLYKKMKLQDSNTLMIDDNPQAFTDRNVPNVILVPAYEAGTRINKDDTDTVLYRLLEWLQKMSYTGPEDVRAWSCKGLFDPSEFNKN